MDRISGPSATPDRKFQDGDPGSGRQGTAVTAAWLNDLQTELIALILASGRVPAVGQTQVLPSLIDVFWPVGEARDNNNPNYNPNTIFAPATFAREYVGMVPVGQQPGDPDFGTVGQTGGEKAHKLITAEMPSHVHKGAEYIGSPGTNPSNGNHINAPLSGPSGPQTDSTGGDQAHNNLQPYKVTIFWRRTT